MVVTLAFVEGARREGRAEAGDVVWMGGTASAEGSVCCFWGWDKTEDGNTVTVGEEFVERERLGSVRDCVRS